MYVFGGKSIYKKHLRANPGKIYNIFNTTVNESAHASEYKNMSEYLNNTEGTQDIMPIMPEGTNNSTNNNANNATPKPDSTKPIITNTKETLYELDKNGNSSGNGSIDSGNDYFDNLDYIGEFDFDRMKANMDELL